MDGKAGKRLRDDGDAGVPEFIRKYGCRTCSFEHPDIEQFYGAYCKKKCAKEPANIAAVKASDIQKRTSGGAPYSSNKDRLRHHKEEKPVESVAGYEEFQRQLSNLVRKHKIPSSALVSYYFRLTQPAVCFCS
jgi:hypothetical protein